MIEIAFTFEALYILAVVFAVYVNATNPPLLTLSLIVFLIHLADLMIMNYVWRSEYAMQAWYVRVIVMNYLMIMGIFARAHFFNARHPFVDKAVIVICLISANVNLAQYHLRNWANTDYFNDLYSFIEMLLMLIVLAALFQDKLTDILERNKDKEKGLMRKLMMLTASFIALYYGFNYYPEHAFYILAVLFVAETVRLSTVYFRENPGWCVSGPGAAPSEPLDPAATSANAPLSQVTSDCQEIVKDFNSSLTGDVASSKADFIRCAVKSQRLLEKHPELFGSN